MAHAFRVKFKHCMCANRGVRVVCMAANLWERVHDAFDLEEIREGNARGWNKSQAHSFKPPGSPSWAHHSPQSSPLSQRGPLSSRAAAAPGEAGGMAFGGLVGARGLGGTTAEGAGVQANKTRA
eukprot:scaffold118857_cov15-Tisochrysis_lutea.AAC.1